MPDEIRDVEDQINTIVGDLDVNEVVSEALGELSGPAMVMTCSTMIGAIASELAEMAESRDDEDMLRMAESIIQISHSVMNIIPEEFLEESMNALRKLDTISEIITDYRTEE